MSNEYIYPQGTPASAAHDWSVPHEPGSHAADCPACERDAANCASCAPTLPPPDLSLMDTLTEGADPDRPIHIEVSQRTPKPLPLRVVDGPTIRSARIYAYSVAAIEACLECRVRLPASLPLTGVGLDVAVLIHAGHRLAHYFTPEVTA